MNLGKPPAKVSYFNTMSRIEIRLDEPSPMAKAHLVYVVGHCRAECERNCKSGEVTTREGRKSKSPRGASSRSQRVVPRRSNVWIRDDASGGGRHWRRFELWRWDRLLLALKKDSHRCCSWSETQTRNTNRLSQSYLKVTAGKHNISRTNAHMCLSS